MAAQEDFPIINPDIEAADDFPEEDDEAAAMAALIGFSGFGNQTSKKRKYNSKTDALIDGQGLEAIDRGGKRGKGSGGNQIPLGKSRAIGSAQTQSQTASTTTKEVVVGNPDEISLDDLENYGEQKGGRNAEIQMRKPSISKDGNYNPNVNPTSPRRAELDEVQRQIDAITTRTSYVLPDDYEPSPSSASIPASLPPRPNFAPPASYQNHNQRPRQNGNGNGERNELWYIGYFDPSFLANPWEALEKEKGLGASGGE